MRIAKSCQRNRTVANLQGEAGSRQPSTPLPRLTACPYGSARDRRRRQAVRNSFRTKKKKKKKKKNRGAVGWSRPPARGPASCGPDRPKPGDGKTSSIGSQHLHGGRGRLMSRAWPGHVARRAAFPRMHRQNEFLRGAGATAFRGPGETQHEKVEVLRGLSAALIAETSTDDRDPLGVARISIAVSRVKKRGTRCPAAGPIDDHIAARRVESVVVSTDS